MKRIIRRVQSLGQKAAELKEAMEKLPPKVAEIREAFTMTTGQLQQLREDVQSSVADLKADDEESLAKALQEINGSVEVFRQAGYELVGVDMDLSINRRLMVRLNKVSDMGASSLRRLIRANQNNKTTHALLQSLARADEVAKEVDLTDLTFRSLIVHVGSAPSARMCWRAEEVFEEEDDGRATGPKPPPIPVGDLPYAQESFFAARSEVSPTRTMPAEAPKASVEMLPQNLTPAPSLQSTQVSKPIAKQASPPSGEAWKKDSLERFKTNPHYSKYRK